MLRKQVQTTGTEYVWQADPAYQILFPITRRPADKTYTAGGKAEHPARLCRDLNGRWAVRYLRGVLASEWLKGVAPCGHATAVAQKEHITEKQRR